MFKLQVQKDKFAIDPVKLETVRPMIFQDQKYVEFCKKVFFGNDELTDAQVQIKMSDENIFNKRKTTELMQLHIKESIRNQ